LRNLIRGINTAAMMNAFPLLLNVLWLLPTFQRLVHFLRSDFKTRLVVLSVPDGINGAKLSVLDDPTLQVIQVVAERVFLIDTLAFLLGEGAECKQQQCRE
jgi:hypothetical protein